MTSVCTLQAHLSTCVRPSILLRPCFKRWNTGITTYFHFFELFNAQTKQACCFYTRESTYLLPAIMQRMGKNPERTFGRTRRFKVRSFFKGSAPYVKPNRRFSHSKHDRTRTEASKEVLDYHVSLVFPLAFLAFFCGRSTWIRDFQSGPKKCESSSGRSWYSELSRWVSWTKRLCWKIVAQLSFLYALFYRRDLFLWDPIFQLITFVASW